MSTNDELKNETANSDLGAVSVWHSFDEMPKWDVFVDIIWADGTEDKFYWSKPNVEHIDFDIDCKPIKWRYACR